MNPLSLLSPSQLLHIIPVVIHKIPANLEHKTLAAKIKEQLEKLMPTTPITVSVSDPVSAMVIAALNFLTTPAGQNLCGDIRGLILDLLNHVHTKVPVTPSASVT